MQRLLFSGLDFRLVGSGRNCCFDVTKGDGDGGWSSFWGHEGGGHWERFLAITKRNGDGKLRFGNCDGYWDGQDRTVFPMEIESPHWELFGELYSVTDSLFLHPPLLVASSALQLSFQGPLTMGPLFGTLAPIFGGLAGGVLEDMPASVAAEPESLPFNKGDRSARRSAVQTGLSILDTASFALSGHAEGGF